MTAPNDAFQIMVVDDKPANVRLLQRMLTERGYRVRPFLKGAMALSAALADPPDVILLDINMPEMDGIEVCRRLKASDRMKDVPIIFISAHTETADKIRGFAAGGVDYITKPFHLEEVHARVETHLKLKMTQQALEARNKALEQALTDLKATQNQLIDSEKMAALGTLTAGIAHEINNPINFIKNSARGLDNDLHDLARLLRVYMQCLTRCEQTTIHEQLVAIDKEVDLDLLLEEVPDLMHNIQEGVKRTEEIVNSLRVYSHMDTVETRKTDIHGLINAALVVLKNKYKNIVAIKLKYGIIPHISVHPNRVIQVFTNILVNAIDAIQEKNIKEDEAITIGTSLQSRNDKKHIVVAITDTGGGIPEAIQARIFDPFFTTKDIGKGTGLGLSISLGIILDHKGTIEVASTVGIGTTFSILLPVEEEETP